MSETTRPLGDRKFVPLEKPAPAPNLILEHMVRSDRSSVATWFLTIEPKEGESTVSSWDDRPRVVTPEDLYEWLRAVSVDESDARDLADRFQAGWPHLFA